MQDPVAIAAGSRFAKDPFGDLTVDTVRWPAGNTVPIVSGKDGVGTAAFGTLCGRPVRPFDTSHPAMAVADDPASGCGDHLSE